MSNQRNKNQAGTSDTFDSTEAEIECEGASGGVSIEAEAEQNEAISLDYSEHESDTSVVFVGEEGVTPKTKKIVRQSEEISKLNLRIRSLKIQNNVLESQLRDTPMLKSNDDVVAIDVNASDLNMTLDEQWAEDQIGEWRENGELTVICDEFRNYLDNIAD